MNDRHRGLEDGLDPEVTKLLAGLRKADLPPFAGMSPEAIRARMAGLRDAMPPGESVVSVSDFHLPTAAGPLPVRRYGAAREQSKSLIVYFHGGGWVGGSIDGSDSLCRAIVNSSLCDLVSVGYRLAPEDPFPAAVEDAVAATSWALDAVGPEGSVALVGDSAGGNLATVACRRLRDVGAASRIALQVLVYPVTDAAMDSGSYAEFDAGLVINASDMHWFWDLYAPDAADRESPDASPLRTPDLAGLPPALILVAGADPLRDEVLAYGRRLIESGVEVSIEDYEGMIHGFFPLIGILGAARQAAGAVGSTVATAVSRR
jgi:acetyl esterase